MEKASSKLLHGEGVELPDPDYDHLEFTLTDNDDCGFKKKKGDAEKTTKISQYILGTLVVRVVAARNLQPFEKEGLGQMLLFGNRKEGTSNPYATVNFCGRMQRTSELFGTLHPVWPREETMFMDVALPLSSTTYPPPPGADPLDNELTSSSHDDETELGSAPYDQSINRPILTIEVFHSSKTGRDHNKFPSKGKTTSGDLNNYFLGMSEIDMTQLLTGKESSFDHWLPLLSSDNPHSSIRIVCEYEPTDPPPKPGDYVRFTRFCNPVDLYPIVPGGKYLVNEVEGDNAILSYTSPEGWKCTFIAHRFMLICVDRHHGAIEFYQDEITSITERLTYSPMINAVTKSVERIPDEGLICIAAQAVNQSSSLFTRWFEGGIDTAIGDVVSATNWDGRFNPDAAAVNQTTENSKANETAGQSSILHDNDRSSSDEGVIGKENNTGNDFSSKPLPNMPLCPITSEQMNNPVVAADGHTYEKSAITRWFLTSDKSPLTGLVLPHKDLAPNYSLLSSLQENAVTRSIDK